MAHFAEIDENNTVLRVLVIDNSHAHRGQDFLSQDLGLGGTWIQTSYNCRGGIHYLPNSEIPSGQPNLRYNYAGVGYLYDPIRDAFIPPKPHPDGIFNETTCLWDLPIEILIDMAVPDEWSE